MPARLLEASTDHPVEQHLHKNITQVYNGLDTTFTSFPADDKRDPEAYKAAIPGSELRIIPQCGHLPHQEKLTEFLAGIDTITNGAA